MEKIDFKKILKELYNPSAKEPVVVDVPEMNFLMIDGQGAPEAKDYQDALEALYSVSYTVKFMLKKGGFDYVVPPLESLWWADQKEFTMETKDKWKWTAMLMQPEQVSKEMVAEASEKVSQKKELPALSKMQFKSYKEGLSVQVMHIGPYADEGPTIEKLHKFAEEKGYTLRGKHHEIYLGDPRRTAPERLKTVIRQPLE